MPSKIRIKSTFVLTSLLVAGCQSLPIPQSDLRIDPKTGSSSGTPLAEILARSNAEEVTGEVAGDTELAPSATETQNLLSIGLSPVPISQLETEPLAVNETDTAAKSDIEVAERSTQSAPTRLKTEDELPPLEASESLVWPEQPATAEEADIAAADSGTNRSETEAAEPSDTTSTIVQQSYPTTVSQQLNWLPSLDDTLAGMDAQFKESASLDEKIDALMSLAFVVDAKLYISFRELLDRLDTDQAKLLMVEQQAWLDQRKENLTRAYLEFKADKAGRYNAAQAFLRNSHSRMREIDARLALAN